MTFLRFEISRQFSHRKFFWGSVGGAIASYSHLAFVKYVEAPRKGPIAEQMGALGASGSAMAVGAFYAVRQLGHFLS